MVFVNGCISDSENRTSAWDSDMIARALWHELDLRHDPSRDIVRNAVGHMTLSDCIWRRVQWVRVRKHMVFAATLLEPLTEHCPWIDRCYEFAPNFPFGCYFRFIS